MPIYSVHRLLAGLLALGLSCVVLTNCSRGTKPEEARDPEGAGEGPQEPKQATPAPVRVVGEIVSVHPQEGFVLIKRHVQGGGFGEGNLIASVSASGRTASLALTGEQKGRYHAADIQDGEPAKGDLVVVRGLPEGSIAPSTPVLQAPEGQAEAPWLKNFSEPGL